MNSIALLPRSPSSRNLERSSSISFAVAILPRGPIGLKLPNTPSYVSGLTRDRDAVEAALHLPWSNGPVEGQVHRLKLIKRQMYGRASFDLLRLRVLHKP